MLHDEFSIKCPILYYTVVTTIRYIKLIIQHRKSQIKSFKISLALIVSSIVKNNFARIL